MLYIIYLFPICQFSPFIQVSCSVIGLLMILGVLWIEVPRCDNPETVLMTAFLVLLSFAAPAMGYAFTTGMEQMVKEEEAAGEIHVNLP
jgi:hypothetical protein